MAIDSNQLFDALHEQLSLKNDAALCRVLCVAPSVISKARHAKKAASPLMISRIHEKTSISVELLREMEVRSAVPLTGGDDGYNPNRFFDVLIRQLKLKNDAALCRTLGIAPPMVSKIRNSKAAVTPALLLVIHEATGTSFKELREILGFSHLIQGNIYETV